MWTACAKVVWQVHTKASSGASPVTSQLRWARLDVTGLAPLPYGVVVVETVALNPLVQGVTHTHFKKKVA